MVIAVKGTFLHHRKCLCYTDSDTKCDLGMGINSNLFWWRSWQSSYSSSLVQTFENDYSLHSISIFCLAVLVGLQSISCEWNVAHCGDWTAWQHDKLQKIFQNTAKVILRKTSKFSIILKQPTFIHHWLFKWTVRCN